METTFITIHNLTPNANILFASESIVDILGYVPEEVVGRSCFDYFHPDEVPFARNVHSRGVQLDKAAVLHYATIRSRDGEWVACDIYRRDAKNERRAAEAPAVRRLFSSSPRDPRYHMLEHLSPKFRAPPQESLLEPRAALILNRFTRTLSVMYATDAVSEILGITADQIHDKSFYECIQENCLPEAIRCLESAKSNDSIAYLRFWYRNPRTDDEYDQDMREASQSSDSEDGGVELNHRESQERMDVDTDGTGDSGSHAGGRLNLAEQRGQNISRTSSGDSTDQEHNSAGAIFDQGHPTSSSSSSVGAASSSGGARASITPGPGPAPFEIEAVVSCTSDGLVVVLRKARALIPHYPAGIFAAPWGVDAIRPHVYQPNPLVPFHHGPNAPIAPPAGPAEVDFMASIKDVAVFAWSLAGINGNMAAYGRGVPRGESQPEHLPILDPHGHYGKPYPGYSPPENQALLKWDLLERPYREMMDAPTSTSMQEPKVPYQHRRQAGYLRAQYNAGNGRMGSDRFGSSAHNYLGNYRMGLPYQSSTPGQRNSLRSPNGRTPGATGPNERSKDNMYPY
ncbi:putative Aryl hydrocarbon receptor nuclear translocator-like protein 2 [Glarea lozoyensis 74030]|uniref:Putative Aryl hydrocarbon receptor nuclear translocator-like protein 2 n=1 Tax=Glarea lozoyensis (strain ATCC 74030 / MF5533) TaxID=1104152 RepID=H0ENH7_GLAL7|nr:putative Aryl hydrocarbon receptor nuclear translocator-like protein 2 [Glarea lozoyensis 74030]